MNDEAMSHGPRNDPSRPEEGPMTESTMTEQTRQIPLDADAPTPTGWSHPINTGHLVMGIAFAGLVAVWALITGGVVDDDAIRWLLPIPWVAAGAIGLAAATLGSLRSRNATN